MLLLQTEFTGKREVKKVQFTQIERSGDICLFKRVDPDGFTSYEVVKVRKSKAKTATLGGTIVNFEAKEIYPQSNEWSKFEKATASIDKAYKYFYESVNADAI
jgi:uncharacterized membrane protein YcaP (DUF421 family)